MGLLVEIFGWLGSVAVLLAYWLISTERVKSTSIFYQGLNLGGSICLIMNTAYYHAYPSTLVNGVWSLIAIFTLIQLRRSARRPSLEA